jgi:hypothetical protein
MPFVSGKRPEVPQRHQLMRLRSHSIFRLYVKEIYFPDKAHRILVQFLRAFSNPDRGLFRSRRRNWQPSDNKRSRKARLPVLYGALVAMMMVGRGEP